MKCRSCGFENMRGAVRCARCSARLVWEGEIRKGDFRPPPSRWSWRLAAKCGHGLDRAMARLRRSGLPVPRRLHFFVIWRKLSRRDYVALVLSVVPGLGCLYKGKALVGVGLFAGWTVCVLGALHAGRPSMAAVEMAAAAFFHFLAVVAAAEPARASGCRGEFWAFCLPVALVMAACLAVAIA